MSVKRVFICWSGRVWNGLIELPLISMGKMVSKSVIFEERYAPWNGLITLFEVSLYMIKADRVKSADRDIVT